MRYFILPITLIVLFALACGDGDNEPQPTSTFSPPDAAATPTTEVTPEVERPDPQSLLSPGYVLDQVLEASLDGSGTGQMVLLSHTVRQVLETGDPAAASVPARESCATEPMKEFDPGTCVFQAEVFGYDPASGWTRRFVSPELPPSTETEKSVSYGHRGGIQGMSDAQTFALDGRAEAVVLTFSYCTGVGSGCGDFHEVVAMRGDEIEVVGGGWQAHLTLGSDRATFSIPTFFGADALCCPSGRRVDTLALDSATGEVGVIDSELVVCTEGVLSLSDGLPNSVVVDCSQEDGQGGSIFGTADDTIVEPASVGGIDGLQDGDHVEVEFAVEDCPQGSGCVQLIATKITVVSQ